MDVTSHHEGHRFSEQPLSGQGESVQRIAVIYDDTQRPDTTGIYCKRALQELVEAGGLAEVCHLRPPSLTDSSTERFDAYLLVDDGLDWPVPDTLRPSVWWAIDTHIDFNRCLERAKRATMTFAAQKQGVAQLQQAGIDSATWLPLACDPVIHGRRDVESRYDVGFVGHPIGEDRCRRLDLIREQYPKSYLDPCPHNEMAEVYSASRIVFNSSVAGDLNMRVFEALASGSLLLTNEIPHSGLAELFQNGEHLMTYGTDQELLEKIAFSLAHDDERERIAQAGRKAVLASHTYRQRMEVILASLARERTRITAAEKSSNGQPGKPAEYFGWDRSDVLKLIPSTARSVLDLGCGAGRLGASLKWRQAATVVGVDADQTAASAAQHVLDEVRCADLDSEDFEFDHEPFDCVICADILEHLKQPDMLLRKVRRWLQPDGCLITSVPNVQNHTILRSLLTGNWTYESAGLLDDGHLRFFTRREIEKLLFRAGFRVEEMRIVADRAYADWVNKGRSSEIDVGDLKLRVPAPHDAEAFFAYQYLTRAVPDDTHDHGLTSIIIPVHNQLHYTRMCVDSIRQRTDEPYELIFIDNGSTDGTAEYLQTIDGATVIRNDANRGFPAAVNQGLEAAQGENLVLLNNDTIVTTGWLRRLLDVLHSDETIGLAGPVSNNVSGRQQVPTSYSQLAELDGYAWAHHNRFPAHIDPDRWIQHTDRLVGFCLLMKRELYERLGSLDEQFGIGCFEDDDYCRRAIAAGYRAVIARNAFVHHFGSVTFRETQTDFTQLMQRNEQLFREKWSTQSNNADLSLSLCMIVRDNEDTIRPCLESIRPWVDEMIVVDTGSTDRTPEICTELGATVHHWPWRDDFAAARNESLRHAHGHWIFWMDSDDVIPDDCGRKLRELVDGPHQDDVLGYVMQVHCPGRQAHDLTVVDHVKLFRNCPDLRFEFRIHEQILPSIRRASGDVGWTDLFVVHAGSDQSAVGRHKKQARDLRLLELEQEDRPDHPFVLFNLGMTHADAGNHADAIQFLERCLNVSGPGESHVRKAYALLAGSQWQLDRLEEAWKTCRQGLEHFPHDKELLFRSAMLHHHFGRLHDAEHDYRRVLDEQIPRHFTSVDAGVTHFKTRHNLALVLEDLGRIPEAAEQWSAITESQPDYAPAWRGLGECLIRQNRFDEAQHLAERLQAADHTRVAGQSLAARLAEQRNISQQIEQL